MKLCILTLSLLIGQTVAFALDEKPWFNQPYEARLDLLYEYSFFHHINHSEPVFHQRFNENLERITFGFCPAEVWDLQAEIEVAETSHQSGYFRSGAVMVRRLWLDDVLGDLCSMVTSLSMRGVPLRSLQDVSTPYSAPFDAELAIVAGKEWARNKHWFFRLYGLFALGAANKGDPWTRGDFFLESCIKNNHFLSFGAEGYFGFGDRHTVDVKDFNGWGNYNHKSIDLGIGYAYKLGIYGKIELGYKYRVYAITYPERVNTFLIQYHIPFSLF